MNVLDARNTMEAKKRRLDYIISQYSEIESCGNDISLKEALHYTRDKKWNNGLAHSEDSIVRALRIIDILQNPRCIDITDGTLNSLKPLSWREI